MRRALLLAALLALSPAAAMAHPHVLVDAHAVVEFKQGKIVALTMGWKFDAVYSGTVAEDFDANKNQRLDPPELAAMEKDAFLETAKQSYFTHVRVDGKEVSGLKHADFKVSVLDDGLFYSFRLDLPQPVDPRASAVSISTYEESYYVDIAFPSDRALAFRGEGGDGCRVVMGKDSLAQVMGGLVTPERVDVKCEK